MKNFGSEPFMLLIGFIIGVMLISLANTDKMKLADNAIILINECEIDLKRSEYCILTATQKEQQ